MDEPEVDHAFLPGDYGIACGSYSRGLMIGNGQTAAGGENTLPLIMTSRVAEDAASIPTADQFGSEPT
jgi:hypothetical protein